MQRVRNLAMNSVNRQSPANDTVGLAEWVLATAVGAALAGMVWQALLFGGGLVGGDTYTYFFPQKQVIAEAFEAGELPLWHDRTALGYPLHAESQAGVFYPPTQLLYRIVDVNSAYNASILLHYLFAFVFTWRFMRSQRLSCLAALFAATAFVYGWFPARISLEWSIIGGVWFPCSLWLTHRLITKTTRGRMVALSLCLGVHLLAGHFAVAFITQLTCFGYAIITLWLQRHPTAGFRIASATGAVAGSIVLALLLAAIQLVPTYELKTISQRSGGEQVFDAAYGHMPPVYLTQLVASWWYWHTPEIVASGQMMSILPWSHVAAATNPVECHFYLGLIPVMLIGTSLFSRVRRRLPGGLLTTWLILGSMGIVYATGWLVPVSQHLPGFGWFMGPGRYTIIAQLAGATIAGAVLDVLWRKRGGIARGVTTAVVIAIVLVDVQKSSQPPVRNAVVVSDAPLNGLTDSWVRRQLAELDSADVRLLIRGPNVGNLYGVSCLPSYLGLGPAIYVDEQKLYTAFPLDDGQVFPTPDQQDLLRSRGVTHVLTTEQIETPSPQLELIGGGPDSFLNRVWGRGSSPCWLYRFSDPPHRVYCDDDSQLTSWRWIRHRPTDVAYKVSLASAGVVKLRELMLAGWDVTVDGLPVDAVTEGGLSRDVRVEAGTHTIRWVYRPLSFRIGMAISLCTILLLLVAVPRSTPATSR
jgi:hypothetical protein